MRIKVTGFGGFLRQNLCRKVLECRARHLGSIPRRSERARASVLLPLTVCPCPLGLLREEVSRLQEEVHLLRQMKEMLTKDLEETQGGKSSEVLSATELRVQLAQKEQELARAKEALQGKWRGGGSSSLPLPGTQAWAPGPPPTRDLHLAGVGWPGHGGLAAPRPPAQAALPR